MILYYSIFIVILLINIFFSIKNRPKQKAAYLLILFLVILYGGNTLNPDYNVYYMHYLGVTDPFSEVGYNLLVSFFRKVGLNYNVFLFCIAISGYFLINKTVKRYVTNTNVFYLFYALYPFLFDIVQIRNFIVLSILIYSLKYVIEDIKRWKVKYIIIIIIASLFHKAAIIYLPLIFIKKKNQRYIIRVMVYFSIMFSFVFLIDNRIILELVNILSSLLNDRRINTWFNRSTNFGFLYNWILQFVNLFFCRVIYISCFRGKNAQTALDNNRAVKIKDNTIVNQYSDKLISATYWINIYATIFLPFYIMAAAFDRFMRNLMLINYIAIICWCEKSNVSKKLRSQVIFCYCIYIFFLMIMNIIVFNPNLVDQIMHNNLLF